MQLSKVKEEKAGSTRCKAFLRFEGDWSMNQDTGSLAEKAVLQIFVNTVLSYSWSLLITFFTTQRPGLEGNRTDPCHASRKDP